MRITADFIDDEPFAELTREIKAVVDLTFFVKKMLEKCRDRKESGNSQDNTLLYPVQEKTKLCISDPTAEMTTTPEEEKGATCAEPVNKQWLIEYIAQMKDELTKDIMQKVMVAVDERLALLDKHSTRSSSEAKKDANIIAKESSTTVKNDNTAKDAGKLVHFGYFCDNCDSAIIGVRYKCRDCEDFDLCEACESIPDLHDFKHVFLKIRYPLSPCFISKKKLPKDPTDKTSAKEEETESSRVINDLLLPVKAKGNWYGKMDAMFVCDETVPDGTIFAPGTKFVKKWRVRNLSAQAWNSYTTVRMIYAHPSLKPLHTEVSAPRISPCEDGVVSVYFTAPKTSGYYESHWEFHQSDIPFGDGLWCKIVVKDSGLTETPMACPSPENSSTRVTMLKSLRCEYPQLKLKRRSKEEKRKKRENEKRKVKHIFEVLSLAQGESEGVSLCRKYVNSHTATPNNTPFDLTPPKSPEPKELAETKKENSISTCTDNNADGCNEEKSLPSIQTLESDDKGSIGSISSSESDSEFVVIPMPKCFNLAEPFVPSQSTSVLMPEPASVNAEESKVIPLMNITESGMVTPKNFSENVSQETGVPEQTESLAYRHSQEEIVNRCFFPSNMIRFNASPSSSSISIIDSENNSPVVELPDTVPSNDVETNQDIIQKPEIVEPVVDVASGASPDSGSSGTFPKFPVEGIEPDSIPTYAEVIPTQDGERTIQVLPEGLVTGALLAAATVYNTARGIISSIQPGKNDQESFAEGQNAPPTTPTSEGMSARESRSLSPLQQLVEMGFCNMEQNEYLLHKFNGNVAKVVEELVNLSDRDWYASRRSVESARQNN